jgi:hypothetical protein
VKIKALSFRQPWADLVLQGKKSLDLRTWSTRYRGPLAVFASQTVEKDRCLEHGIDPDRVTTGAVIGLVDLVGVVELDDASYAARASEHLSGRQFHAPMFGWEFTNPRLFAIPQPEKDRQLLFEVDLPQIVNDLKPIGFLNEEKRESRADPFSGGLWENSLPFELRLVPEIDPNTNKSNYRLGLYQRKVEPTSAQRNLFHQTSNQMERVVELGGIPLRAVADQVLEALRENGYKVTDLSVNRREPFLLQEESGVRLGVLFMAVKRISKVSRIEVISTGIRDMTSEELYYWYSKCTSRTKAEQAQKALRILLAKE